MDDRKIIDLNEATTVSSGDLLVMEHLNGGVDIDTNKITVENFLNSISVSGGKVDDVKVNGTSVVTDKVANIDLTGKQDTLVFNTTYDASSNKAATMQDITDAINNIPKYTDLS